MYKAYFLDYRFGGNDIQRGRTYGLESILNRWDRDGYDFISMTPCPEVDDATKVSYMLVFKKRD